MIEFRWGKRRAVNHGQSDIAKSGEAERRSSSFRGTFGELAIRDIDFVGDERYHYRFPPSKGSSGKDGLKRRDRYNLDIWGVIQPAIFAPYARCFSSLVDLDLSLLLRLLNLLLVKHHTLTEVAPAAVIISLTGKRRGLTNCPSAKLDEDGKVVWEPLCHRWQWLEIPPKFTSIRWGESINRRTFSTNQVLAPIRTFL